VFFDASYNEQMVSESLKLSFNLLIVF